MSELAVFCVQLQASPKDPSNRALGIMSLRPMIDLADSEHGPAKVAQEPRNDGTPTPVIENMDPGEKPPAVTSGKPPSSRRVAQSKAEDGMDPTLTANAQLSENRMRAIRRDKAERERKRRENMEKQHDEVCRQGFCCGWPESVDMTSKYCPGDECYQYGAPALWSISTRYVVLGNTCGGTRGVGW